jgi:undecaprenyl-diphosphatase
MDRQDAANFSFLMATPIIAGAGLIESRHFFNAGLDSSVLVGFSAAAVFGLIAIAALIRFLRTRSYGVFAWYRVVLGALVFAVAVTR